MPEASRPEGAVGSETGGYDDFASFRKHRVRYWFDLSLGLPADLAGRLYAQQVSAILRVTPFMMGANIFAAILCVVMFWSEGNFWFLTLWAGVLMLTSFIGLKNCIRARSRKTPKAVSKRAIARVIVNSAVPAVIWSAMPIVLFANANAGGKLLISSIVIGTICVGLFGLSTIPMAALAYGGIIVAGSVINMVLLGEDIYYYLSIFLVLYFGVALSSVCWNANLFRDRFKREVEAERQKELVGILLNDFEQHASDWLWETDDQGRLKMVSGSLAETLQTNKDALIGRQLSDLVQDPLIRDGINVVGRTRSLAEKIASHVPFRGIEVVVSINGTERWWTLTGKPIFDDSGHFSGYRGAGSDVTATREARLKLSHMAHYDTLTDLPNRALLHEHLNGILSSGRSCAVLFIDLDQFKEINDTLGHSAGDALLIQMATRIRGSVPGDCLVSRLGGDEFALIIPSLENSIQIDHLAARIISEICEPMTINNNKVSVGASIGIASAPRDGVTVHDLFRHADLALYRAKSDGRGIVRVFMPEMEDALRDRRALEDDLHQAEGKNQLEVYYQPIIDLKTGQIAGAEALLRWNHPTRGWVSPATFIPIAEATGEIVSIGEWVLKRACMDAALWPRELTVAVNVSPAQFRSKSFPTAILRALTASRLPATRLEIEITESVLLDEAHALEIIDQLTIIGTRLALDDFGTGYSSLSYLRSFPFNKLKIDQCFVREAIASPSCAAIVETVAQLSNKLGLVSTAEGIENINELEFVKAAGCILGQGYYFARPMPVAEFQHFVDVQRQSRKMTAA
ncbi:putative bifunctional diguanylate cyclase/phosphodiesterase [Bradyrhizobium sp.]|uniref:putative bifunctional diguanylate cyclase/phosphodiesterase n=1 Tax=Bradyrhizobium sp. TaxID=376 RepID=UPI003C753824